MRSVFKLSLVACFLLSSFGDAGEPKVKKEPPKADPSIVPSGNRRVSEIVENGIVYDKAVVSLENIKSLVVPENAEIVPAEDGKVLRIYQAKVLSFVGHPPLPITLRHVRANMGAATKGEGETLHLGTFGEWDTRREGTATLRMRLVVPKGIRVEKRANYAGPESIAHSGAPGKEKATNGGYWYSPRVPSDGWTAVAHEPDPMRQLEEKKVRP